MAPARGGEGRGSPTDITEAPAIVASALTKHSGARRVVEKIDLELPAGVVSGFVGPNGAGKTTRIQLLLGLIEPTSGTARVLGHPISDPASYLPDVGALIESPSFYPTLSGARNLEVLTRSAIDSRRGSRGGRSCCATGPRP